MGVALGAVRAQTLDPHGLGLNPGSAITNSVLALCLGLPICKVRIILVPTL